MSQSSTEQSPEWVVHSGPSPADAIRAALAMARRRLDMEVAFVSQFRDGRRWFRHVDSDLDACPVEVGASDPLDESFCLRVVDGRLPELMPDARRVDAALDLPVTAALPVGAHASVPIRMRDGRVYGTFCCFSRQGRDDLHERDLEVMRTLADFVAEQIDREAVAESEHERRESERQAAFIQSISHEVRTPLTVIRGTTELLRGRRTVDAAVAHQLLDALTAASARLGDLVDRVVETADLMASDPRPPEPVFPAKVCLEAARALGVDRRLTVAPLPEPVVVPADPRLVRVGLQAALEHAVGQSEPGSAMAVSARTGDGEVEVTIRYESLGIEALAGSTASDQEASGTGIRLLLAKALVNQAGGRLAFRLQRPHHAEIRIVLPIADRDEVPRPVGAPTARSPHRG